MRNVLEPRSGPIQIPECSNVVAGMFQSLADDFAQKLQSIADQYAGKQAPQASGFDWPIRFSALSRVPSYFLVATLDLDRH